MPPDALSRIDPRSSAYYDAPVGRFLEATEAEILGQLTKAHPFTLTPEQRNAWVAEIGILRAALRGFAGHLYLEFDVPRLGSRIDAVLVAGACIVPIEFKVGSKSFERADRLQAWDYALDLKNFHLESHSAAVFPVLVATEASGSDKSWQTPHADDVRPPYACSASGLMDCLLQAHAASYGASIVAETWGRAPYHPTPTIIQAARALYARHSVEEISRNDAGARNLSVTSRRVEALIDEARRVRRKLIILVTGVPGAGKTLVGLNVATRRGSGSDTPAVFLSGNGPLVAVLREALVRDEILRDRAAGGKTTKKDAAQRVKAFIQNVHRFRDDGLRDRSRPPVEHVVIFDEAQRAWNKEQLTLFMRRRKSMPGFSESEPEVLIEFMDRHRDWAVIVALVGGGQEINTGEAGIEAWLEAIDRRFPHWHVHASTRLGESEDSALSALEHARDRMRVSSESELHLSVSLRSFRAENVSHFVRALLDGKVDEAREQLDHLARRYPLVLTRDLDRARYWLRSQARGTEQYGLVSSSSAERLKPHAIDVRVKVDPVPWFLNDPTDTRSSWYLEDVATEFQIQGLELDWIGISWDADLRRSATGWSYHGFRSDRWVSVKQPVRRQYLLNAYRVLLTRARQGMVIFVPPGNSADRTRSPEFYDGTFEYLASLGVPTV